MTRPNRLQEYQRINRPGLTVQAAAEQLGVTPRTVGRIRHALGLSSDAGSGRRMTPELREEIAGRLADGWPFSEISATYRMCHKTLQRYFPGQQWQPQQIGAYGRAVRSGTR